MLCVDCDDQANLSNRLLKTYIEKEGMSWFDGRMTFENLFTLPKEVNSAIYHSLIPLRGGEPKKRGIDIIPSKPSIIGNTDTLVEIEHRIGKEVPYGQIIKAFDNIRRTRDHMYDYDFCLVDFSGSSSFVNRDILASCDYIVAPCSVDINSIDGILQLSKMINKIKEDYQSGVEFLGVFFSVYNNQTSYDKLQIDEARDAVKNLFFDTTIRYSTEIKWSLHSGVPLAWSKKTAKVTLDYECLINEIIERLGGYTKCREN